HGRRLDAQRLAVPLGDRELLAVVDHSPGRDLRELRRHDRALDRVEQVQPQRLAILADVREAVTDRAGDVAELDLLTVLEHLAAEEVAVRAAEDAAGELGASGSQEAGDADDLATADGEP